MSSHGRARRIRYRRDRLMCDDMTDLIVGYLTGELHPDTAREFEAHLDICADCVAFLNTYKTTVQMTRSLRYEDIPAEMKKRVRHFLQKKMKATPRRR